MATLNIRNDVKEDFDKFVDKLQTQRPYTVTATVALALMMKYIEEKNAYDDLG